MRHHERLRLDPHAAIQQDVDVDRTVAVAGFSIYIYAFPGTAQGPFYVLEGMEQGMCMQGRVHAGGRQVVTKDKVQEISTFEAPGRGLQAGGYTGGRHAQDGIDGPDGGIEEGLSVSLVAAQAKV